MLKNSSIFDTLAELTQKVLPLVDPCIKNAFLPDTIKDYPNLTYKESGFPSISGYPSRVDISRFFKPPYSGKRPAIDLTEHEEFNKIIDELVIIPEIKSYYGVPQIEDKPGAFDYLRFNCENLVEGFIERYYYMYGTDFHKEKLKLIYKPVEKYIFSDKLSFDISIPLLFIKFETDLFELTPTILIRKIDDQVQRSRHKITGYSPAVVDSVFMSATHELVLKDYSYDRPATWLTSAFNQSHIYPAGIVEKFLTILKIATDCTSGFAQFIVHPKDWAYYYNGDLAPLTGASIRSYPGYYDDYYWNNTSFPKVSADQLEELKKLFTSAMLSKENKLEFAFKRFYKAIMRQEEEDIIIDLIIALEMLLSDNEKTEITHKLALRISALLSLYKSDKYDPIQVFQNVKKIYTYRSSIVHGSHKTAAKREIKVEENVLVPLVNLANDYLRDILKIVITDAKYLKPEEIDRLLLVKS
jgi:hypothetical protein